MSKSSKNARENNKDLIDQIVDVRKGRKLTQEELAKIMTCPQSSISRVENRSVSPTLDYLKKMCDALGIIITIKYK